MGRYTVTNTAPFPMGRVLLGWLVEADGLGDDDVGDAGRVGDGVGHGWSPGGSWVWGVAM